MKRNINPVFLITRGLIILVLILFNYGIFSFTAEIISDSFNEQTDYTHTLQESIAEEDYGNVYGDLNLFDLYDEEYDDMWNVAEAYHLYCLYTSACRAAEVSDDPGFTRQCEEQAALACERLNQLPDTLDDATARAAIQRIRKSFPENN